MIVIAGKDRFQPASDGPLPAPANSEAVAPIVRWLDGCGWQYGPGWVQAPFGRRLSASRKGVDWSQERLAQEITLIARGLGVASATVHAVKARIGCWERQEALPTARYLYLASEALEIPPSLWGVRIDPDFQWPPPSRGPGRTRR